MKKIYSVITVAVFIVLIAFFTGFSIFGEKRETSVNENRALQQLPALSLSAINDGSFQKQYNDYLSDQFEFRDFWVKAKSNIMLTLGQKDMNDVYFGSDDYLIEKYSEADFNKKTIKYNTKTLTKFLNAQAEDGFDVTCAFIPSKGTALKSKMPKYSSAYDTSYVVDGVKKKCKKGVNFVDLNDTLSQHADEGIYYKTDHHWTSLGAYYAYCDIMKASGLEAKTVDIDAFTKTDVTDGFLGSTYDKVQIYHKGDTITKYDSGVNVKVNYHGDMPKSESLYYDKALEGKSKYEYFLGGNYSRIDIRTDVKNGETLLLIKDSFSNSLVPFLVNNFRHIIMVDLRFFNGDIYDILDEEDISYIFVVFNTEKFMTDEHHEILEPYIEEDKSEEDLEDEELLKELEREEREQGLID